MNQLKPPTRFDWQGYLGRDLFTADNQRIGIVSDIRRDPRSGGLYLIVDDGDWSESPLCVPAEAVGVATRFRLMLDVISKRLPHNEWRRSDWNRLYPA